MPVHPSIDGPAAAGAHLDQADAAAGVHAMHADADPILVVYATQSGLAEGIARDTADILEEAGHDMELADFYDLTRERLESARQVLFLVSTTNDGNPPDMAEDFRSQILPQPAALGQMRYAMLAVGDSSYGETYCVFAYAVDAWLQANGARRWADTLSVDDGDTDAISRWQAFVQALVA